MKIHYDDLQLDFKSYDQLCYQDDKEYYITLFLDGNNVGNVYVYIDKENESREYICINYEILYLDTLKQI